MSFRHLMLVPVLSIVICLLHVKELFGQDLWAGVSYIGTFGVFYVLWIWGFYSAAFFALRRPLEFREHAALAAVAAVSGLYLAQAVTMSLFHQMPRLGAVPFFATYAALFLLVTAFRSYRERLEALSRATIEAQYTTLKNQLRPHFLFNSLNSLSELIERDPRGAVEMTQKLSDLYRQLLQNSTLRTASLSSELEIIEKYLEIERLRFEDRVRYQVEAPSGADAIYVPSLMLQTLVENAVKHGIAPAVEGGAIDLKVEGDARDGYRLTLKNTGVPFDGSGRQGTGLRNTRERLKLLYGAASRFSIARTGARETVVSFHVSGACLNDG